MRGTTGRAGNQVRLAPDIASAEAAVAALAEISPGQPFLQEYVTGRTILVGGLFDEGASRQWFVAEKVDLHLMPFGPSIRSRSIHMPEAIDLSARIFAPMRFHGLGFAEFIVPPDGPPVFVEINPRQWGSIRAARSAGLDFLARAAKQIAGHIPDPSRTYPAGREASLFPQYLAARIFRQRVSRHEILHIARALRAVPWRDPVLAVHFFRELNWHRHAIGGDAIACGQQGPDIRCGAKKTTRTFATMCLMNESRDAQAICNSEERCHHIVRGWCCVALENAMTSICIARVGVPEQGCAHETARRVRRPPVRCRATPTLRNNPSPSVDSPYTRRRRRVAHST